MSMRMSRGGKERCVKLEGGYVLKAYLDGAGVPTIGAGHTRNVVLGMIASVEQCEAWFEDDIRGVEKEINAYVKVPLNQNQFDALCIWEFNTGGLRFTRNGVMVNSAVLNALNLGKYEQTIDLMQSWKYITKKDAKGRRVKVISNGLVNRRAQEAIIWSTPTDILPPGTTQRPAVKGTSYRPEAPPTAASQTTTGKAQVGAIGASAAALLPALTSTVDSVRPVIDATREALGFTEGFPVSVKGLIIAALVVSIGFNIYTLWHKQRNITGSSAP